MPIAPAVADHDRHAMNEPTTKQDLYNMGVQIDSNFGKVDSRFDKVEGQFVNLRTDMNAGFDRVDNQITNLRTDMNAGFDKVEGQFVNLRTDMDSQYIKLRAEISEQFSKVFTMFGTMQVEQNKTLFKLGAFLITTMIAILGLDRWWL
jgi:type I restriction-modification system DNA methylase subunit